MLGSQPFYQFQTAQFYAACFKRACGVGTLLLEAKGALYGATDLLGF